MPTLEEFVNDKAKYPDDMKVALHEGVEVPLGQLRSSMMLEKDYRQKTMKLSQERKAFDEDRTQWESARLDAEAKLTELAKSLIERKPEATKDEVEELLERDPVAKRLMSRLERIEAKEAEVEARWNEIQQRQRLQEEMYIADQHRRVLATLQARDKDLDPEALVNFAKTRYIARLDDAYIAQNHEKLVAAAVKEAKEQAAKESYDRAKKELLQPVINPNRFAGVPQVPEAAKSFDEAYDNALKDPEIVNLLMGGGNA